MRKSIVLIVMIFTLCSIESYAQKSKREEIYKNKLYKDYIDVNYYYGDDNKITSTQVMLYGQDLRYQQLAQSVTIYSGSSKELLTFMDDVEKFYNENDPEVSTTIDEHRIKIVKQSGIKGFYIYEKEGSGYRGYNMKTWGKIRDALVEWAKKNNEPLD